MPFAFLFSQCSEPACALMWAPQLNSSTIGKFCISGLSSAFSLCHLCSSLLLCSWELQAHHWHRFVCHLAELSLGRDCPATYIWFQSLSDGFSIGLSPKMSSLLLILCKEVYQAVTGQAALSQLCVCALLPTKRGVQHLYLSLSLAVLK